MTSIIVVATNTLRQTIRQRLFFNIIVFGVGMLLLSMVVGQLTFGYPDRVVRSIGLSGVALAVDLMALLVAVGLVYEEIDRKTLFVVLTRPLGRWQYVVGRYLGLVISVALALVGFSLVFVLTLWIVSGEPSTNDFVSLALVLPEACILAAFGLVLSTFSTPTLSSGIGLGFWIAAATTDDLVQLTTKADALTKALATGVSYVLPSLARFNFRGFAVHPRPLPWDDVLFSLGYGSLYIVALVALACAILSRREMV